MNKEQGGATRRTFAQQAACDVGEVFFNGDEHATLHTVNGKEMLVILDENELLDRSAHWEGGAKQSFDQGLYRANKLFYVQKEVFGARPKINSPLTLDGRKYSVSDCTLEDGVYAISLVRIRQ